MRQGANWAVNTQLSTDSRTIGACNTPSGALGWQAFHTWETPHGACSCHQSGQLDPTLVCSQLVWPWAPHGAFYCQHPEQLAGFHTRLLTPGLAMCSMWSLLLPVPGMAHGVPHLLTHSLTCSLLKGFVHSRLSKCSPLLRVQWRGWEKKSCITFSIVYQGFKF